MSTCPLEREILTHFWVAPHLPYKCPSKVHEEAVERFITLGLLSRFTIAPDEKCPVTKGKTYGGIMPNREALASYMAALDAVPLPVQRWEIPPPFKRCPKYWGDPIKHRCVFHEEHADAPCLYEGNPPASPQTARAPCPVSSPFGNGLECTCPPQCFIDGCTQPAEPGSKACARCNDKERRRNTCGEYHHWAQATCELPRGHEGEHKAGVNSYTPIAWFR